jgi:cholesterol transport system auxiliary component
MLRVTLLPSVAVRTTSLPSVTERVTTLPLPVAVGASLLWLVAARVTSLLSVAVRATLLVSVAARAAVLLSLALLAGCAIGPQARVSVASYDFGLPRADKEANPRLQNDLVVAAVTAPAWMDNTGIYYRLAYQDATRPQAYAQSRWVMPPAALLGQSLRAGIARANKAAVFTPADGARADYTLRLELEEFSQVFDAADKSRAVVRLRASLIRNRGVVAQQTFNIERAAATPDAEGGVRALIAASEDAGSNLIDWLAASMKR